LMLSWRGITDTSTSKLLRMGLSPTIYFLSECP
jgi:hypothetical protein